MPRSATDTLRALIEMVETRDFSRLADVYAEDVVVEHAFGVGPHTRWEGRESLAEHFSRWPAGLEMTVRDLDVYSTDDPDVAFAEFTYDGRVDGTGRTFTVRNLIVGRARDGRLVETRDYHNHAVMAAVFGALPEFVKEVEKSVA